MRASHAFHKLLERCDKAEIEAINRYIDRLVADEAARRVPYPFEEGLKYELLALFAGFVVGALGVYWVMS